MSEQEHDRQTEFSELLARHRSELYGYIFAVVRNWEDADDLFQAVCLILWSKFDTFQIGTNFFAWARQTAKNKMGTFLRHRPEPDIINEELLETLTTIKVGTGDNWAESYLTVLQNCRSKLANMDEELLELHYGQGLGTRQISDRLSRNQASICRALNRIRCWLLECIQREVSRQEHSRS